MSEAPTQSAVRPRNMATRKEDTEYRNEWWYTPGERYIIEVQDGDYEPPEGWHIARVWVYETETTLILQKD